MGWRSFICMRTAVQHLNDAITDTAHMRLGRTATVRGAIDGGLVQHMYTAGGHIQEMTKLL